jgi:hypothetical protein
MPDKHQAEAVEACRDEPPSEAPEPVAAEGAAPSRCHFTHPFFQFFARRRGGFFTYDEPLAEAAFVVLLDNLQVHLGAGALGRELRLGETAPQDDRLLQLVIEGVQYVDSIPLGCALPSEVVSGTPSWQLPPHCLRSGAEDLARQLSEWVQTQGVGDTPVGAEFMRLVGRLRATEADALRSSLLRPTGTASTLPEGAGYRLAEALGYLACLRERKVAALGLLLRSVDMAAKAFHVRSPAAVTAEGLRRGLQGASARLDEALKAASQLRDIAAALHQADAVCAHIGRQRNAIHSELRHLEALARSWQGVMIGADAATRALILDSYRVVARRDMPAQQWVVVERKLEAALLPDGLRSHRRPAAARQVLESAMVWWKASGTQGRQ